MIPFLIDRLGINHLVPGSELSECLELSGLAIWTVYLYGKSCQFRRRRRYARNRSVPLRLDLQINGIILYIAGRSGSRSQP